jgi:hypothetical protein
MPAPLHSPASDRNKQPILDVLRQVLPARGIALEIASGTGQHAAWFAAGLPGWTWQPTDVEGSAFSSIEHYVNEAGLTNVRPPLLLNVLEAQWPSGGAEFAEKFDAIFCANMIHISPWATCAGLMRGSAKYLAPEGLLITYGPYLEDEVVTSPGNVSFDQSLRGRDPAWGIRRREDVEAEAARAGLRLRERFAMPANNLILAFSRAAG